MDLDAYLRRVGLDRPDRPSLDALRRLHAAHVAAIPFENLDVQMGRPIRIEIGVIEAKLVTARRGGYCYEQNTLFSEVLRTLGFDVRLCEARVRLGSAVPRPRTHAVLAVTIEGRPWLCDVGFGCDGLMEPLPFDGRTLDQEPWSYRLVPEGNVLVLQRHRSHAWDPLYALSPEGCLAVDYEMANWYTSTFPESRFVLSLTAQRTLPRERRALRNLTYTVVTADGELTRELRRDELVPLLREAFDIELPPDARFRALDTPGA